MGTHAVDEHHGGVVTRDEAGNRNNQVPYGDVLQVEPSCFRLTQLSSCSLAGGTETNRLQNDGRVEAEAVEGNIEGKPRPGSA